MIQENLPILQLDLQLYLKEFGFIKSDNHNDNFQGVQNCPLVPAVDTFDSR